LSVFTIACHLIYQENLILLALQAWNPEFKPQFTERKKDEFHDVIFLFHE
jgi:hypothetical protein